jgi:hypothetical protein
MPNINPASDLTSRKRYCLTEGQGVSNCCSGPVGPPGPSGAAGPPGVTGLPGTLTIDAPIYEILFSDGASGASASPFLIYNIVSDRLAVGQGVAGLPKVQSSTSQIAIGNAAGANQSTSGVIAIGNNAGYTQQGLDAIAIGYNAGYFQSNNADRAIAIGAYAGQSQSASSIILNAAGTIGATTDGGVAGFFVNPIRAVNSTVLNPICYDISKSEIVYNTASNYPLFKGYVAGVFEVNGSDPVVSSTVSAVTYDTLTNSTGGLTPPSPSTTRIVLPKVGLYEFISVLQCTTPGSPTTVSAWHTLNGSTFTTARTVSVTSGVYTILTVSTIIETALVTDYVELQVYSPGGATLTTFTVGSSPSITNSAVVTTVKLVG